MHKEIVYGNIFSRLTPQPFIIVFPVTLAKPLWKSDIGPYLRTCYYSGPTFGLLSHQTEPLATLVSKSKWRKALPTSPVGPLTRASLLAGKRLLSPGTRSAPAPAGWAPPRARTRQTTAACTGRGSTLSQGSEVEGSPTRGWWRAPCLRRSAGQGKLLDYKESLEDTLSWQIWSTFAF